MSDQIIHFIINHWMLVVALVIVLILLGIEESKGRASGNRLSPQDATALLNREHAVLVDIRDATAFAAGHPVNALNLPHTDIMNNLVKLKKYQNRPIILIDQHGQQANATAFKLQKQGFAKVYSLAGGVPAWTGAGFTLTQK